MTDLLLISPDSSREVYQGLADKHTAIETPTWALLLAGALRRDYDVAILDPLAERLTDLQAGERVAALQPKLIAFVVYGQNPNSGTTNMAGAVRLARQIRQWSDAPIAFIGPHASALPDETLALDCVDYVIPGDGLHGLRHLLDNPFRVFSPIVWAPLADASEFTEYPWDLLPSLKNYRAYNWFAGYDDEKRSPYAAIYTSLGCVFKCDFCMINMVNRTSPNQRDAAEASGMRFLPTDMVLREFEKLAALGVKNVRIADEMFFLNRQHYLPILNGLVERNLGLNLWAYARVDTVRPEHLALFKQAGVNWICLGIEAANQTVRREATKGRYEDVNIRQVCREIQAAGINLLANFIIGLPEDTPETVQETLDLALDLCAEHTNFYPCMALPGSPLYRMAVAAGTPVPDSFSAYSFHSYDCQPLPTKTMTAAEVLAVRDKAWHAVFTDPRYLSLVHAKFGQVAVDHIEKQTQITLRRKLLET